MPQSGEQSPYWDRISHVDLKNLATTGKSPYFNLEPGYRLRYAGGKATRTMTGAAENQGHRRRGNPGRRGERSTTRPANQAHLEILRHRQDNICPLLFRRSYSELLQRSPRGSSGLALGAHGAMFTLVLPAGAQIGRRLAPQPQPEHSPETRGSNRYCRESRNPGRDVHELVRTETKGSRENKVKVFAPGVGLVQDGPFALVKTVRTVFEEQGWRRRRLIRRRDGRSQTTRSPILRVCPHPGPRGHDGDCLRRPRLHTSARSARRWPCPGSPGPAEPAAQLGRACDGAWFLAADPRCRNVRFPGKRMAASESLAT